MMNFTNFREFLLAEHTGYAAFTSQDGRRDYMGHQHELPDTLLDFPTITKTAPVTSCRVVGKNYCIQLQGEATIYIECKKYHLKFGERLPEPGEVVTAVWYKFKKDDQENYTLKTLKLGQAA